MKSKNWTKIYNKYKGLWVALKQDEETVVGSGKTLKEAMEQAKEKGYERPIMTRVPEKPLTFVVQKLYC